MANLNISRAQRLDQKVIELIPQLSRAYATRLIEEEKVRVNGEPMTKPGYKLRTGDEVVVDYDIHELDQIPDIDLPVLYEDEATVVINKPVGVLSHGKGVFNQEATVATWLRAHVQQNSPKPPLLVDGPPLATDKDSPVQDCPEMGLSSAGGGGSRAGIVHRLDRATSGVMICAKTAEAMSWLQKQFSQRKTHKTYYAVVTGHLPHDHAVIDMPIERNPQKPQLFRVGANGKSALTEYWVKAANDRYSLLELKPQTGRTHQLRVHLSQIGHPIVGDPLYGGEPAGRLYLHAESLEITLPSRERKTFTASLPGSFRELVRV
jgi:23S rRNA pseudouridine1911/1915/1917 synthase